MRYNKSPITALLLAVFVMSAVYNNALSQWERLGMSTNYSCYIISKGQDLYTGTYTNGIFKSTDSGNSWAQTSLNNRAVNTIEINGNNIFAGTSNKGVMLSTDDGATWNTVNSGLTNLNIYSLVVSGGVLFSGTFGAEVFSDTNNVANWTACNNGVSNPYIYPLAVSGADIYAGAGQVFRSTNGGALWNNIGLSTYPVSCLLANGGYLFTCTLGNGIFFSSNNGTAWTPVNKGTESNDINYFTSSGNNVSMGNFRGVYYTSNNGVNWIAKNQGFGTTQRINGLFVFNNYIFCATGGYFLRRKPLKDILTETGHVSVTTPANYSLEQNYPNRFNPVTVKNTKSKIQNLSL